MEVIYIGDKYYRESSTVMSPYYKVNEGRFERTDLGFITLALKKGETVTLRPATEEELELFDKTLEEALDKMAEIRDKVKHKGY